jgi:hypothetical protein
LSFASPRRGGLLVLLAATVALAGAAPAMATVTTATVTTPSDPTFLQYDVDGGASQTFDVEGTSDGTTGDAVDVICTDTNTILATAVPVDVDGSFSAPGLDVTRCPAWLNRILAVPTGQTDGFDLFTGPLLGVGSTQRSLIDGAPSGDALYDYEDKAVTAGAVNDYLSASGFGFADSWLFDADGASGHGLWANAATLQVGGRDGHAGRSEITVDGHDAYTPRGVVDLNSDLAGPVPQMSVTDDFDPATGAVTIHETDPLVFCGDGSGGIVEPTDDARPYCPEYLPAPAVLERTITEARGGRDTTIADAFTATDGATHTLALSYDNPLTHGNERFPGESGYTTHDDGATPSLGGDGHGAIFLEQTHGDPGHDNVQSAIAYATRPDRATVRVAPVDGTDQTTIQLQYTRTIPATGSADVSQTYIEDYDRDAVTAAAGEVSDAGAGPTVAFTSPADGAGTANDFVVVSGTAFDNGGVRSLTVGGLPTAVRADGTWSQTITGLTPGDNTITAVAEDGADNVARVTETVVYTPPVIPPAQDDDAGTPPPAAPVVAPPAPPSAVAILPSCTVPNVAGLASAGASAAIVAGGCSIGAVTSALSSSVAKGSVLRQSRAAGAKVPVYFPVDLVLSSGKPGQAKAVASATLKGSKLTIKLTCPQADGNTCTGSITITSKTTVGGHRLSLGTHKFTVRAGRSTNVVFTVKSTAAKAIRHLHTLKATVSLKGAASGSSSSLTIKG